MEELKKDMAELDLLVETDVQVPQRQGKKRNNGTSTLFICVVANLGSKKLLPHMLASVHMHMGIFKSAAFSMRFSFLVHMQTGLLQRSFLCDDIQQVLLYSLNKNVRAVVLGFCLLVFMIDVRFCIYNVIF